MKKLLLAVSVVALMASFGPSQVLAQNSKDLKPAIVYPEEIRILLADDRPPQALSVEELMVRRKTARLASNNKSFPDKLRKRLKAIAVASRLELEARGAIAVVQNQDQNEEGDSPPPARRQQTAENDTAGQGEDAPPPPRKRQNQQVDEQAQAEVD